MSASPSIRVSLPMQADDLIQLLEAIRTTWSPATVEADEGAYDLIIRRSGAAEASGTAMAEVEELRGAVEQARAEVEMLHQSVAEARQAAADAQSEVDGLRTQVERGDFA